MPDWLVVWGIGQATAVVFRPILEDLAQDVAKDIAKSYVGRCFKRVFSVIHRGALTRATGLAIDSLITDIENELAGADVPEDAMQELTPDVKRLLEHESVQEAIASLFLQPEYELDPGVFADAWQSLPDAHDLPPHPDYSWERIARRFARQAAKIRVSTAELRETFESLGRQQDSEALRELSGLPPDFDLDAYREALVERHGTLDFATLDMTGAYYNDVRLWSVFVPQSVRECHEYDPQLLEVPKEHLKRLVEAGELDDEVLADTEKHHEARRQALPQPTEAAGPGGGGRPGGSADRGARGPGLG